MSSPPKPIDKYIVSRAHRPVRRGRRPPSVWRFSTSPCHGPFRNFLRMGVLIAQPFVHLLGRYFVFDPLLFSDLKNEAPVSQKMGWSMMREIPKDNPTSLPLTRGQLTRKRNLLLFKSGRSSLSISNRAWEQSVSKGVPPVFWRSSLQGRAIFLPDASGSCDR